MTPKPFILIGTPCYGSMVAQSYMESVVQLITYAAGRNFDLTLALLGGDSLITRSRNKLVATFLDMPQATHLLFIDADIAFQPAQVERLLNFDQDVVAGMYPVKAFDWAKMKAGVTPDTPPALLGEAGLHFVGQPCVNHEREERNGFVTGTYAGTGFMLIKRDCLTRMIAAYPETKYKAAQVWPRVVTQSENQYALFDCLIEPESGIYLSEDFAFCRRWRAIGGKIWLDTEGRLTHIGGYRYEGMPSKS
jgi:hypothetical protein